MCELISRGAGAALRVTRFSICKSTGTTSILDLDHQSILQGLGI